MNGSLTWKENWDRVVCIRAEIRFVNIIFSDFSYKVPFHHRPGQIERINIYVRTILRACQSHHFILSHQPDMNILLWINWVESVHHYPNRFKFVISPLFWYQKPTIRAFPRISFPIIPLIKSSLILVVFLTFEGLWSNIVRISKKWYFFVKQNFSIYNNGDVSFWI